MKPQRVWEYVRLSALLSAIVFVDFGLLWLISSGIGLQLLTEADWQTFVPDVLVALITGVLVGLALLIVQNRGREKDTRAQADRDWRMVRARLRGVVHYRETVADVRDLRNMGSAVSELLAIGRTHPLSDWSRVLNDRALPIAIDAIGEFEKTMGSAHSLEAALSALPTLSPARPVIERMLRAGVLKVSATDWPATIGVPKSTIDSLKPEATDALRNPVVKQRVPVFAQSRDRALGLLEQLAEATRQDAPAGQTLR